MKSNTKAKSEKLLKEQFAKRLQERMLALGYSSKKSPLTASASILANFAEVSRTMANRYLNGAALPDVKVLHKIAGSLETDPWWLLHGTKDNKNEGTTKISQELAQFILLSLKEAITKSIDDDKKFLHIINDFIEIYNNISEIDADLSAKLKSAEIMTNFINRKS